MKKTTYNASQAREHFYSILKDAAIGQVYEVNSREMIEPVVIVSRSEYDSWQETLDLLASPKEVVELREALREKETMTHDLLLTALEEDR